MKKYRYVVFTDRTPETGWKKSGKIFFCGEIDDLLAEELELNRYSDSGTTVHATTLNKMGMLGWKLEHVTPCGFAGSMHNDGTLEHAYVFSKEIDEEA